VITARTTLRALARRLGWGSRERHAGHATLAESVLWQTLPHRHAALTAATAPDVVARHEDFLRRSPSYRETLAQGDARLDAHAGNDVAIAGLRFRVPADSRKPKSLSDRVLDQRWLPLLDILRSRELAVGGVMVDIGANIGTTSIPRIVLGDFQVVYAAEPAPANYAALVQNIVSNQLTGRILPDRVAIGSSDAEVWMKLSPRIGGHKVVKREVSAKRAAGSDYVKVSSTTLDRWVAAMNIDLDRVTFIKCDTQGFEGHVLRGADDVLRRKHIAWQMELWPRGLKASGVEVDEVVDRLASHFTHFINLREDSSARRLEPTANLRARIAGYAAGTEKSGFADVILYNATKN